MNGLTCHGCESPLSGGLDTFGPAERPLCWTCWSEQGRSGALPPQEDGGERGGPHPEDGAEDGLYAEDGGEAGERWDSWSAELRDE